MFADTLLDLERGHLLRLGLWAGASALTGLLLLLFLMWRKGSAPFVKQFAVQMFAWGTFDLAIVAWGWRTLGYRDYASAMQFQQFLWLNVGLDMGYAGIGATLAIAGWKLGQRMGAVGAGVAIIVQAMALLLLDLRLLLLIGPPR